MAVERQEKILSLTQTPTRRRRSGSTKSSCESAGASRDLHARNYEFCDEWAIEAAMIEELEDEIRRIDFPGCLNGMVNLNLNVEG